MNWPGVASVGGAAGAASFLYYVCAAPSSQILGRALVRGPAAGARVALTFDDGPAQPYTLQILDILRHLKTPATFFVCGKNVERFPQIARRIRSEGHGLGNHTYSHPFLYFKGRAAMAREIDRTQQAIERVTGHRPTLFRPPYGGRWFGLFSVLAERGLRLVQWSTPSHDWKRRVGAADIVRTTLRKLHSGSVVLLHDGREPRRPDQVDARVTVEALPGIIEGARAAGFTFVPIEDFLA